MNYYKISFEQLRQKRETGEILSALERGFKKFDIDFYLVGAVARDVWMNGVNNIAPRRTTTDIDFAVLINDKQIYQQLKDYLINKEGFAPYSENAFVLLWKDRTEIDLLPFGEAEDKDRRVSMDGRGFTTIDVPGFKEVYESGLPGVNLENHQFKVCPLPGIVLLKLLAWEDRPEVRRDDIKDICDILKYFDALYPELLDNHYDLYAFDMPSLHIEARALGREMGKIAKRNGEIFVRIEKILTDNTQDVAKSRIAVVMNEYFSTDLTQNVDLLKQIKQGMSE